MDATRTKIGVHLKNAFDTINVDLFYVCLNQTVES